MRNCNSLFDRLKYFSEKKVLRKYYQVVMTNVFHSAFNAWMSALSIMALICFTGWFGVNKVQTKDFLFQVGVYPLLIATICTVADMICVVLTSSKKVYTSLLKFENNNDKMAGVVNFEKEIINANSLWCIMGVIAYILAACINIYIVQKGYLHLDIMDYKKVSIWIFILSVANGLIWNISSLARMKRIDFYDFLNIEKNENTDKDKIQKKSFVNCCIEMFFEVLGCLFALIGVGAYYYFAKNDDGYILYSVYYSICYVIMVIYIKYLIKFEYNTNTETVYPFKNLFN